MRKFKNILILGVAMVATVMLFQGRASAEEYTVPSGTVYWESSYGGGTGKSATVSGENVYTPDIQENKMAVKVDGYSILNKDGSIAESHFNNGTELEEIPQNHVGTRMMLHIWSEKGYRLGWIDARAIKTESVSPSTITEVPYSGEREWIENVEPKDPDEIVRGLQELLKADESIPREAYVLGDVSGSMWEYYEDVLQKLEGYYGEKFLFAVNIQEFCSGKQLYEYELDRGGTDISGALNSLIDIEPDAHVYLLSDLQDNMGSVLKTNERFNGEITLVLYKTDNSYDPSRFIRKLRERFPNAVLTGF